MLSKHNRTLKIITLLVYLALVMLSVLGGGDYAAAMGYYIPFALILYFVMAGIKKLFTRNKDKTEE